VTPVASVADFNAGAAASMEVFIAIHRYFIELRIAATRNPIRVAASICRL
jgi:hypothetical protein